MISHPSPSPYRHPLRIAASLLLLASCLTLTLTRGLGAEPAATPTYAAVDALLAKHCLDCHSAKEPDAGLVLESFTDLMNGGESGPAILPRNSTGSLLIQYVEGRIERDGKKRIMPPGKRTKLTPAEISTLRAWIDAGAVGSQISRTLQIPRLAPTKPAPPSIRAVAFAPNSKRIALAKPGLVEILDAHSLSLLTRLTNSLGPIYAVLFSPDETALFAGGGDAGIAGEIHQWELPSGKLLRSFPGHPDTIHALAISPDGRLLASAGYDQVIRLWDLTSGAERLQLKGHNGAVNSLSFRKDGRILASGSSDRTVKLWDTTSGERRDTLAQSSREIHTVAFSPTDQRLFAAGADNRIRIWQTSDAATETTNPLLESRYAHEGSILRLTFSPDGNHLATSAEDRSVKLWETQPLTERLALEKQPDWAAGLAFGPSNHSLLVGRLDGSFQSYDTRNGRAAAPAKPTVTTADPSGIQQGATTRIRLLGSNLTAISKIASSHPGLTVTVSNPPSPSGDTLWLTATSTPSLPTGPHQIILTGPGGDSAPIRLTCDPLPQRSEPTTQTDRDPTHHLGSLPVGMWGRFDPPGNIDRWSVEARAGQTLVFEVAARTLASKAIPSITLLDPTGLTLTNSIGFEGGDPVIAWTFKKSGTHRIELRDQTASGSRDHFYRLSVGTFGVATGLHPLTIPTNATTRLRWIGLNLPKDPTTLVTASGPGELPVTPNPAHVRTLREFKVRTSPLPQVSEQEPNDSLPRATPLNAPAEANGVLHRSDEPSAGDVDLYRFQSAAGQTWVIETIAAQRGSPADTRLDVLTPQGQPVERTLLQAVRNTAINFRPIDSNSSGARLDNYEEMELNEYLYLKGEVVRLFRMPQGPDSEMLFYSINGKRRTWFDTSPTSHALEEPCFIVTPHPPGTPTTPNGLPLFKVPYANDDDGERKLGTDSKILFTAPTAGTYLVRVTDTRNLHGPNFSYTLALRLPQPDFKVTLSGGTTPISPGSGQPFTLTAERIDGFEGEIRVDVDGLPQGFHIASPITIEAGHLSATGSIQCDPDAPTPPTNSPPPRITASAQIHGSTRSHTLQGLGPFQRGAPPKLRVSLEPESTTPKSNQPPPELVIHPGQTLPARLKIQRNGHDDLVTFDVENLPHGVIVDNIGLNGVLIPKGDNERQIFLSAARWVPESDRWIHAVEKQTGRQTSPPILLKVRRAPANASR